MIIMNEQKKKKIKIGVITAITIAGLSIAAVTANKALENVVTSGTVNVEAINLQIKDKDGNNTKELKSWDPGDVNMITWKVKNSGTAAVYTRNRISIYWNEDFDDNEQVLYLYPANMSKSEIIEDYKKGADSKYAINVEVGDITLEDGTIKRGIQYSFNGDSLDGSEMTGLSKEENYNSADFTSATDDSNVSEDDIAFNILLSPKTTYLYGDKTITIDVVTEAMQHTDDGKEEWHIVDKQSIGN